jgi:hypothetical protein
MAVNDLSYSVQTVVHWWQRRFLLEFILKFSSLNLDLYLINLFIGAIIDHIDHLVSSFHCMFHLSTQRLQYPVPYNISFLAGPYPGMGKVNVEDLLYSPGSC